MSRCNCAGKPPGYGYRILGLQGTYRDRMVKHVSKLHSAAVAHQTSATRPQGDADVRAINAENAVLAHDEIESPPEFVSTITPSGAVGSVMSPPSS